MQWEGTRFKAEWNKRCRMRESIIVVPPNLDYTQKEEQRVYNRHCEATTDARGLLYQQNIAEHIRFSWPCRAESWHRCPIAVGDHNWPAIRRHACHRRSLNPPFIGGSRSNFPETMSHCPLSLYGKFGGVPNFRFLKSQDCSCYIQKSTWNLVLFFMNDLSMHIFFYYYSCALLIFLSK